ncbi:MULTISPECIES: MgtC/SapB family protein [unclassified Gluconobacter]|uniref:MgtC/SapB family protein n=1 Tax=unclassified Gluconobacter TaxID=2644261 RepID=UPI001C0405B9|nr:MULTISPECIES: MgtC/SapB family protein [unclassified Gluconobacter]
MTGFFDLTARGFIGEGRLQLEELVLAFILSSLVGLERELRQKSAGLRTHTLVGVSAALFMLISKYGFMDILAPGRVVLDPSRVAAQVVSGIGFVGGGVIFMRRDIVRGLTTAASIWFTAALGMACGGGLILLALATTGAHFIVMVLYPRLLKRLPNTRERTSELAIQYREDMVQPVLTCMIELGFSLDSLTFSNADANPGNITTMTVRIRGKRAISHGITALAALPGVQGVHLLPSDKRQ